MKLIKIEILMIIIIFLSISNLMAQQQTNTYNITVSCQGPYLQPDNQTLHLGTVIASGQANLQNFSGGPYSSVFTFEGEGTHAWTVTITEWDKAVPPGTGPKAYIESYWEKSEDNGTTWIPLTSVTQKGHSFSLDPTSDACNAQAKIRLTATKGGADVNFKKTELVPFVFMISVTY